MLHFLSYTIVIFLSLVGWVLLASVGYLFLRYHHHNRVVQFSGVVAAALCGATAFNVWYEGWTLIKHISLISSINSWAFVFITPVFYLYFRFLLTGCMPCRQQWARHLLLPGALLLVYAVAALVSSVPDKLIYAWYEFRDGWPSWWTVFRIGCYVVFAGQMAVYLPRLFGAKGVGGRRTFRVLRIRREMQGTLVFCGLALGCMLTGFFLFRLLYALSILFLGGYLFYNSPLYRWGERWLKNYLLPLPVLSKASPPKPKLPILPKLPKQEEVEEKEVKGAKEFSYLTNIQVARLEELLRQNLGNPGLKPKWVIRELCTNQTYLLYYFRYRRKTTYTKYVTSLRMEEAERLLLHTDLPVVDIAERTGFLSVSAFYVVFATCHTLPPSQWRLQARAGIFDRTPRPKRGGG